MQLMASKKRLLLKVPKLSGGFEPDMVDLAGPHVGAFRRHGHRGHAVGVPTEEVHLLCLPLLDTHFVAHGVDYMLAVGVHL